MVDANPEAQRLAQAAAQAASVPPPAEPAGGVRPRDAAGIRMAKMEDRLLANVEENAALRDMLSQMNENMAALSENLSQAQAPGGQHGYPGQPAPQTRVLVDPATGQYVEVPIAAAANPYAQPAAQQGAPESDLGDAQQQTMVDNFGRVADNLQYYGQMHPRAAEAEAEAVIREQMRTGASIDDILLKRSGSNEGVRLMLSKQLERMGAGLGADVTFPEPETPAEQPVPTPGTPSVPNVTGGTAAPQAVAEPVTPSTLVPQSVIPAVVGGASVTPNAPPPETGDDKAALQQKINAIKQKVDTKYIADG